MITTFTFTYQSAWNHTIQFLVAYRDLLVYDLSNCFANFGNALIFVLTFACVVYVHSLWFRFWIEPRAWEPRSATHLEWYIIWHILLLLFFFHVFILFSCLYFSGVTKVYDAINEHPDADSLGPLIETTPKNKATIEFHAIACAGKILISTRISSIK